MHMITHMSITHISDARAGPGLLGAHWLQRKGGAALARAGPATRPGPCVGYVSNLWIYV